MVTLWKSLLIFLHIFLLGGDKRWKVRCKEVHHNEIIPSQYGKISTPNLCLSHPFYPTQSHYFAVYLGSTGQLGSEQLAHQVSHAGHKDLGRTNWSTAACSASYGKKEQRLRRRHLFLNNSGSISLFPNKIIQSCNSERVHVVLLPYKTPLSVLGDKIPLYTFSKISLKLVGHFASTRKQGGECRKMTPDRLQYPPLEWCMFSTGGMTLILSLKHESDETTSKHISLSNISLPGDS